MSSTPAAPGQEHQQGGVLLGEVGHQLHRLSTRRAQNVGPPSFSSARGWRRMEKTTSKYLDKVRTGKKPTHPESARSEEKTGSLFDEAVPPKRNIQLAKVELNPHTHLVSKIDHRQTGCSQYRCVAKYPNPNLIQVPDGFEITLSYVTSCKCFIKRELSALRVFSVARLSMSLISRPCVGDQGANLQIPCRTPSHRTQSTSARPVLEGQAERLAVS